MSHRLATTLAAFLLATLATTAGAQSIGAGGSARMQQAQAELEKRFTAADTNHDGQLTRSEAQAMPRISKNFDAIDTAGAGYVTREQITQFVARQMASRQR